MMRIDELSRRSGIPSRTIRYYNQQGLLAPPELRGRVGYYSDAHLERLRLIKDLRDKRYLPLSVIRNLLHRLEAGGDLEALLAPLDMVYAPKWDSPGVVELTRADLAVEAGVDADVVDVAEEMGFLFPTGRGQRRRYTADDVQMVQIAQEWMRLGLGTELGHLYRRSLERIAREHVEAFDHAIFEPLDAQHLSGPELRERLVEAYTDVARTSNRLIAMLQRKLLQKAVESYSARLERGTTKGSRPDAISRSRPGA